VSHPGRPLGVALEWRTLPLRECSPRLEDICFAWKPALPSTRPRLLQPGDCESGGHERPTRHGRSARPCSAYARAGPGDAWPRGCSSSVARAGEDLLLGTAASVVRAGAAGVPVHRAGLTGHLLPGGVHGADQRARRPGRGSTCGTAIHARRRAAALGTRSNRYGRRLRQRLQGGSDDARDLTGGLCHCESWARWRRQAIRSCSNRLAPRAGISTFPRFDVRQTIRHCFPSKRHDSFDEPV
jgi:hypothetical protein